MTEPSELVQLVENLSQARVLCVGDLMLDRFVHGSVDRISPEAPIPILQINNEISMPGGAGNVVRNLAALGANVRFITALGNDSAGKELSVLLNSFDRVDPVLVVDTGRTTSIKTRYLAGNQQILRADQESTEALAPELADTLLSEARRALKDSDLVVLSDYGKGVLSSDLIQGVIEGAREAGKPVIVDPKGHDYARYQGADLITPNLTELEGATHLPVTNDDEVIAAAQKLIEDHDLSAVLATRSKDGMTLVAKDGEVTHLAAEAREVFDVSGAGDTVVATLGAAMCVEKDLARAAKLANIAAGIVVGKVGTAVAYAKDVIVELHHQEISSAEAKVLTLEQALDQVGLWRRRKIQVGFTNGCFDLLHPGHVSLLAQAKDGCNRLIVGLNSDASVTRLKGEDRPIQSEASRAAVLASLASVDMVVIFSEDTPIELIKAIQPDVLVKGADYSVDEVVGSDVVQSYGGRILLADLEDGHSTTATIKRMAQ
ncbi:MAG: D-glycero-beta-D-manno-heptose-7-phosphate kinase [Rhodospirillaceae bacterium]|jgi:D-beta-D-heptose 7-phosphate kinase / D-beta-D-heptose 1-phosphate adenosyltransferase|nr:D-glycero-beta-D-manno-heptose-7-phosphate kinase [Rhodospirillaceae bacterium]MBT5035167.1 D-glycero-beta-D-manno-heptose-7-phosphate kinase [Rhodospirillaceae bacterium]MBT6220168.1 D-glycero-beta-D-manno-heptose-7-phosphate kinase [Rhodospirillaceae bacterium]MBT6361734.1 D-glycero-beta-D-manno-heptose-7-phosphate kinase [Rhodospirillaceae bacterium]